MSDYKATTVGGNTWQRCCQIVIDNPLGAAPGIRFEEEEVVSISNGPQIKRPLGGLPVAFDPTTVIPLRDPTTGVLTGEVTNFQAAYAMLYSAYMAAAVARDAALAPPPQPAP